MMVGLTLFFFFFFLFGKRKLGTEVILPVAFVWFSLSAE